MARSRVLLLWMENMTTETELKKTKAREARLRRLAHRQGLRLVKSRTRDPDAHDFGLYGIIDPETGGTIHPSLAEFWICALSLDAVEDWLAPTDLDNTFVGASGM
jgi:hypothetical protein